MKRAAACLIALALLTGMCLPFAASAQNTAWTVSLSELTSDDMGENERAGLDALLEKLRIDALVAEDGAFAASFGAASLYYAQDTGLLVYLPDKALSQGAGLPGAMEAILTVEGGAGTWYRPTVSGMPISSSLLAAQRPALLRLLGDALGLDLSGMKGEGMASLMSPDADGLRQAFEYLLEDLALIAQRIESSLSAVVTSGRMETLMSGLSDGNHLSLSSSTLAMVLWDAQRALADQIDRFLGRQAPDGYGSSGSAPQMLQESKKEQALPELLQGLHFSDLYAQVYQGVSRDLYRAVTSSYLYYMLGRPVSLPWFSLDAGPSRMTLAMGDSFFMTADSKPSDDGSILWIGKIYVSGSQPLDFELKTDRESAALRMHNKEGGLEATLSYSLPDWSQDRALFTLNASAYSLEPNGMMSNTQSVSGTLYIDQDTVSLQGSNGRDSISAQLSYDETGFSADIASAYRGEINDPAYHAEIDWQNGLNAQFTQTRQNGVRSGTNVWIIPQEGAVSFGFGTIEAYGTQDLGKAIMKGSFTQKDGSEQLVLEADGTTIDLQWMKLGEGRWRALAGVSQAEQDILHMAVDVEASAGTAFTRPDEYIDVDLVELLNAAGK